MSNEHRIDEFIRLFTAHEPRLRAYVLTLIPRWSDAEEVMQQCNLILWQKFDRFEPGTNFFAWACQIARLEAKAFRKKLGRERVMFTDEFADVVADEAAAMAGELDDRQQALQHCIVKLPDHQRKMLALRYQENGSVEVVARSMGRTVEAVYKALSRIRQALFECINRTLAVGES